MTFFRYVCFFVLLDAAVLSNSLANFSKELSVESINSKYGVIGFGYSFKADVRYFAACKIWSEGFIVGISIL